MLFLLTLACSCKQANHLQEDHPALLAKITDSANILVDKDGAEKAFQYFDERFALIHKPGIGDQWNKYYFKHKACLQTAWLRNKRKYLQTASLYADTMLAVIKDSHAEKFYKNELCLTDFAKGDALFQLGQYDKAYVFFYQGKLIVDQSHDICNRALFANRIALMRYRERNYKQAAPLFLSAYYYKLACNLDFQSFAETQGALDNAGLSYEAIGMLDSALMCYNKTLAYLNDNASHFPQRTRFIMDARGVTYGYLGMLYRDKNNIPEAIKWFKMSIAINSNAGNEKKNSQVIQLKLAHVYFAANRMAECDSLLGVLRTSLDTLKNENAEQDWLNLKWTFYDRTHQTDQAYRYFVKYSKLRDSIDAETQKLRNGDFDIGFKDVAQQYQLAFLNKNNEVKSTYIVAIIIFTVLLLGMLLMSWVYLKNSKKNINKLTVQNAIISGNNAQMQKALDALEQSQSENTRMMNIVAHDLRSPIGGITIAASRMLEDIDRPEKDHSMLNLIKTSGKNSLALLSDLLQVNTRMEELNKEPVDMNRLLYSCVELLRLKAEEKGQRVELDAGHFTLHVNREKMWRVISNLITNAIKFSPGGATITVLMLKKEDNVLISVEDQGIGIPEHMEDKIFDMFTEFKRPGTIGEQPFGIGLAICKQIVRAHGGKIWFESQPNKGTCFYVELPISIGKEVVC